MCIKGLTGGKTRKHGPDDSGLKSDHGKEYDSFRGCNNITDNMKTFYPAEPSTSYNLKRKQDCPEE